MRLNQHMASLLATGRSRVGWGSEVKRETVFAEHAAKPGTTVETDIDFSGFLDHNFKAP